MYARPRKIRDLRHANYSLELIQPVDIFCYKAAETSTRRFYLFSFRRTENFSRLRVYYVYFLFLLHYVCVSCLTLQAGQGAAGVPWIRGRQHQKLRFTHNNWTIDFKRVAALPSPLACVVLNKEPNLASLLYFFSFSTTTVLSKEPNLDQHRKLQIRYVNSGTKEKDTALHIAAQGGYIETVKTLISIGAMINVRTDTNQTPLHLAAIGGQLQVVRYLLINNAKIGARDDNQMTPLHK